MARQEIMSARSIFTAAVVAVALVVAAMPLAAQTSATSDDWAAPAVVHNTWSSGAPMPTAIAFGVAGTIGKDIYVVGGSPVYPYQFTGLNQIYSTKTKTWTTGAPDPTVRGIAAGAVVDGILYVIGGYDGGALNVVEAYDPVSNTWSTKASLPTARWGLSAAVDKDVIYTVGGYNGGSALATVESYNTTTNTWTEEAPLLVAKLFPAVGLLGATIVAADGYVPPFIGDNEAYTVKKNTWKELTADPTPRGEACSSVIKAQLYVAGGSGNGNVLAVNEAYSAKTNSWTALAAMPDAVVYPQSAEVGGLLYCFGGYNSEVVVIDNVQIYQP